MVKTLDIWSFNIGTRAELSEDLYEALAHYRFEVFVRRLGWALPSCETGREQDQFDTEGAIYLVATRPNGEVGGCARLLPTTRCYLLAHVFPHLVEGPSPSSPSVWELSRFSATPLRSGSPPGSHLPRALFQRALDEARLRGARRVVGVLSIGMERVCRGFGADLQRLGPPQLHHGSTVLACAIDVAMPPQCRAGRFPRRGGRACTHPLHL